VNAHSNNHQVVIDKTDKIVKKDISLLESPKTTLPTQIVDITEDSSAPIPIVAKTTSPLSTNVLGSTPPLSTNLSISQTSAQQLVEEIDDSIEAAGNKADLLIQHLNDFYEHLDQQQYMKAFNFHRPSKDHFSILLQNLINSPPVVTDETNDLFTLLKNTAHFFRILGKENIIALKGILDREKASFEDILKTFYSLTDYPDVLKDEYGLTLSETVLYDYAGFFLNTMGGRLYLFRRDSASRLTVSFYAIQIIDDANSAGNNRHGINLVPAIDFLITEMENTGKHLLLKDEYLDTLYDLKEKYN
ncbi:MAG: hypothetical protein KAI39_03310, partial [Desulfobulbaceae bacterium]|nr:hypothetical protein [Desulfobulbaceae bacterium]